MYRLKANTLTPYKVEGLDEKVTVMCILPLAQHKFLLGTLDGSVISVINEKFAKAYSDIHQVN